MIKYFYKYSHEIIDVRDNSVSYIGNITGTGATYHIHDIINDLDRCVKHLINMQVKDNFFPVILYEFDTNTNNIKELFIFKSKEDIEKYMLLL